MDEIEKAKQAWKKYYEAYYGGEGDDFEPDNQERDLASSNAIIDFQSSLISALEKEIEEAKGREADDPYIAGLLIAISLVKTTLPKNI